MCGNTAGSSTSMSLEKSAPCVMSSTCTGPVKCAATLGTAGLSRAVEEALVEASTGLSVFFGRLRSHVLRGRRPALPDPAAGLVADFGACFAGGLAAVLGVLDELPAALARSGMGDEGGPCVGPFALLVTASVPEEGAAPVAGRARWAGAGAGAGALEEDVPIATVAGTSAGHQFETEHGSAPGRCVCVPRAESLEDGAPLSYRRRQLQKD